MYKYLIILFAILLQACASGASISTTSNVVKTDLKYSLSIGTDVSSNTDNNIHGGIIVINTSGFTSEEFTVAQKAADEWDAGVELVQGGSDSPYRMEIGTIEDNSDQAAGRTYLSHGHALIVIDPVRRPVSDWITAYLRLVVLHELGHLLADYNCGQRGYHLSSSGNVMYSQLFGMSTRITAMDVDYIHCKLGIGLT